MTRRILRMVAAILGATIALWLLSGDRDPEAFNGYDVTVTVHYHETFDFKGIQFFELAIGGTGTRVTVSADGDLALTKWLYEHRGQRVALSLVGQEKFTR